MHFDPVLSKVSSREQILNSIILIVPFLFVKII